MNNQSVMKRGETSSSGNKLERKTIEKNRRIEFKDLCFKLVSLIPDHYFNPAKEMFSQLDQIEQATTYITVLRERIEELRRKKAAFGTENDHVITTVEPKLPILNIREFGSNLEVVLVSGMRKKLKVHEVIRILEQEGAEVVTVSISSMVNEILYTIHAQVKVSRLGMDTSRIRERVEELIS